MFKNEIAEELQEIYNHQGGLDPEHVVAWAKSHPDSALYSRFNWDDVEAAQHYRLWQARQLIVEVRVTYPDRKEHQVYVSLTKSRGQVGYETLIDVLADPEKKMQLFQQALQDLRRVRDKYKEFKELAEAINEVVANASLRG